MKHLILSLFISVIAKSRSDVAIFWKIPTLVSLARNDKAGFTLIELLWSVAIAAMLSAVGIAAFFTYSRLQTLNAATSDFVTTLQAAKSNAQSQVKPTTGLCSGFILDAYKVVVTKSTDSSIQDTYELDQVSQNGTICAVRNQRNAAQRQLPKGISFSESKAFVFPVLSGGATSGCVIISGLGNSRKVSVSTSGVITAKSGATCP